LNSQRVKKTLLFFSVVFALSGVFLTNRDGMASDAPPTTSSTSVVHDQLYKKLYVFYKGGLQSKFGDSPIKRVSEGVIYDLGQPGVIVEFMRGSSNGSELVTRIWLEISNKWDDRAIAECKDKERKVSLEMLNNSNCLDTDYAHNCIVANCG
jgi:hypothetical protein